MANAPRPSRPLIRALCWSLPLGLTLLTLAFINPQCEFWSGVEPPKAQCEAYDPHKLGSMDRLSPDIYDPAKLSRLLREPQNTLSNLPYAVAGLAILFAARRPASKGLGWSLIFLGFGSGMYHASLQAEWRMIDILGVYAVLYAVGWIGLCHSIPAIGRYRALETSGTLAAFLAAVWTGIHRNDVRWGGIKVFDSTYVFVAGVALGCTLMLLALLRTPAPRSHLLRPLTIMLLAAPLSFAGGIGDRFGGFWAAPEAWIQGHTVWHSLGAVALAAAYEVFAAAGFDRSILNGSGR